MELDVLPKKLLKASELEVDRNTIQKNKVVGLFFARHSDEKCQAFSDLLSFTYNTIKEAEADGFEVIYVSLDSSEKAMKKALRTMPWVAVPYKTVQSTAAFFNVNVGEEIPQLIILENGEITNRNGVACIQQHGAGAYPFSQERMDEIVNVQPSQQYSADSLQSLLVDGNKDYLIRSSGEKELVISLLGKHLMLFFHSAACQCPHSFMDGLYEIYNNLRESDANFEVIYVSNDLQRIDFNNCFQNMPWLSFPFDIKDTRRSRLLRKFKIETIPEIVVISPNGICLNRQAKKALVQFRDDAYPYSDFDLKDPSWKHVRNVAHPRYEDEELQRLHGAYKCNICGKEGWGWFYFGEESKSSFHPRCLLAKLESN